MLSAERSCIIKYVIKGKRKNGKNAPFWRMNVGKEPSTEIKEKIIAVCLLVIFFSIKYIPREKIK
jgi:hypothetical protein